MIEEITHTRILGNTVLDYLVFAGILLAGSVIIWFLRVVALARLKQWAEKSKTTIDDFFAAMLRQSLVPLLYFGLLYVGIKSLVLHPLVGRIFDVLGVVVFTYVGIRFVTSLIEYVLAGRRRGHVDAENTVKAILPAIHVVVWTMGVLYLLENLGFKISAVIAGLGITGIAVALAAQAVLKDAFSYFAILLDRPFEVGDFIIVGDVMGSVERVGVKTTKLRSLSGEQIICSNSDLTDSRVRNYKRMSSRRVAFTLNLSYETPRDRVEKIPGLVKSILGDIARVTVDRVHFAAYGDFSLKFEVVYYVLDSDYNLFMDIQQQINLRIMEVFEKEGVRFAYPTQSLYLHADPDGKKA